MEEARAQVMEFCRGASVEGKPRRWMVRDVSRPTQLGAAPVGYAYNTTHGGVCCIVALAVSPFVITVVARKYARQDQRLREERERADRMRAQGPRRTRFLRKVRDVSV